MAKVSIIMVTADHHAPYIGTAIQSVLNQTYTDWELIIVDDGPKWKVADTVGKHNDHRTRYIQQENVGVWHMGETYNRGLRLANGSLIAILEGDDRWPQNKLELQVQAFEPGDALLSYGIVKHISSDEQNEVGQSPPEGLANNLSALNNDPVGKTVIAMARYSQFISSPSIMIRRDALEMIGGFIQPGYYPAIDFPTVMRMAVRGRFQYLPMVLGFSRVHANSVTSRFIPGKIYLLGMFRYFLETVRSNDLPISEKDADEVIAHWKRQFFGHYLVLGRHDLVNHNISRARHRFIAASGGAIGMSRMVVMLGLMLSYLPPSLNLLEYIHRMTGKKTIASFESEGFIENASEIISTFEAWATDMKQLCYVKR